MKLIHCFSDWANILESIAFQIRLIESITKANTIYKIYFFSRSDWFSRKFHQILLPGINFILAFFFENILFIRLSDARTSFSFKNNRVKICGFICTNFLPQPYCILLDLHFECFLIEIPAKAAILAELDRIE